ncbi:MAG: LamG domain-containing protein, partial [Phycisphaeraceae bacterium]|nr:LamG domain-containing protein [Phycisphaeraceae bacterium]
QTIADASGNNFEGRIVGKGARFLRGRDGNALNLINNCYVEVPKFDYHGSTITITGWVFSRRRRHYLPLLYWPSRDGRSDAGVILGKANDPTLRYVWNDMDIRTWDWQGGPVLPAGQWAFFAVVIGRDGATIYSRPLSATETAVSKNPIPHHSQTLSKLHLGYWDSLADPAPRIFNGMFDDIRIYKKALGPGHIEQLIEMGLEK